MNVRKVHAIYFSPTGTTARAVLAAAKGTGLPVEEIDLTNYEKRRNFQKAFSKNEMTIVGLPVYAGRLPAHLDDFFAGLQGNGAPAAALVMYGHREYNDALLELKNRLEERGFNVIAGAAFIGEHTFSKNIAPGRPDEKDLALAREFGNRAANAAAKAKPGTLKLRGDFPYKWQGYDPANPGIHVFIPHVVTGEECILCGTCVEECPWGAIALKDTIVTDNTRCLRCFRCFKVCPAGAKKAVGEEFYKSLPEFEKRLNAVLKQPEMFFGE
jgi:ferredoxin